MTAGSKCLVECDASKGYVAVAGLQNNKGKNYATCLATGKWGGDGVPACVKSCLKPKSVAKCGKCVIDSDCTGTNYCCPTMKKCILNSATVCPSQTTQPDAGCGAIGVGAYETTTAAALKASCTNADFKNDKYVDC